MQRLSITFLLISGLLLLVIGTTILLVPHGFYASDGIVLGHNPSLLSEIRAPGGLLTTSALVILAGAVRPPLRVQSTALAIMVYGSFGLARLVSVVLDGQPSATLMVALGVELGVAVIGLGLLRYALTPLTTGADGSRQ